MTVLTLSLACQFVKICDSDESIKLCYSFTMPAPQGHEPYEGGGRPKGVPNKATSKAREAIGLFVDNNSDRLLGWLDRIAENDPEAAFKCFMSVVEYHIPKLARSETAGDRENPLAVTVTLSIDSA